MLKIIKSGGKLFFRINRSLYPVVTSGRRTFLSESYSCNDVWHRRFEVPIIQKANVPAMYTELESTYNTTNKINAIDVDVFANAVTKDHHYNELLDLLLKLRSCTETSKTLDSTHHAVVRYLMEHNRMEELYTVLNDRIHYGIFPDDFALNLLMNNAIQKEDYAYAAKIATLFMLQEETGNPISVALSLYGCHKYLENVDAWKYVEEKEEEIEEDVFVRVPFIRNPYFDDHFDLREPRDLVGKTLAFQGKHLGSTLGRSCQLRGLVLFKKYDTAEKLIKEWMNQIKDEIVYEETLDLIQKDNSYIPEDQVTDEFKSLKESLAKLKNSSLKTGSLTDDLKIYVEETVQRHTEEDIAQQQQMYTEWHKKRIEALEPELVEMHKQAKKKEFEEIKKKIENKEKLLTFFDREEEIELQIEKLEEERKQEIENLNPKAKRRWQILQEVGDENYVSRDMKKAAKLQKIIDDNLAKIPKRR